jgi:hypothetical protein
MGKTKVIELTAEQRAALEKGYRTGKSHCFRTRCQMSKAKYEWLKPVDYLSFDDFKQKVAYIFANIGTEYKIKFKELKCQSNSA